VKASLRGSACALVVALVCVLAAYLALAAPASADSPVVTEFKLTPPDHLTVGDRIPVSITVEADRGTRLQIAPGGVPDGLAVAESPRFSTTTLASGRVRTRIDFAVAAFVVGDYPVPPLKLRYQDIGGNVGELQTPAARLTIESTLPSSGPLQARDLKPQAEIGAAAAPPYEIVAVAGGLLALALALLLIAWRRTRRRPVTAVEPPAPEEELGPEDAARRALDGAAARLATEGDLAGCYASLSATVREYLTRRFGFPAFALTTAELQAQMVFRGIDRWQARLAGGLLEQCDAVVFAHYLPAAERAQADLTAAYEIIEMSRPREEAAEVATA
jgi:hypothetical protein